MSGPAPWWEGFFDDLFAQVLLEHGPEELEAHLDFLVEALELDRGARVFDQCCGPGGIALPLAGRGYELVGVDQARGYIERARREAGDSPRPLRTHFELGDATEYVPAEPCDGAFNWYTSFGYAEDDATNRHMLACAFRSLRPGGKFALDYANVPGILHGFRESIERRHPTPEGEIVLVRHTRLDLPRGMMRQRWCWTLPGGECFERPGGIKLYPPHRLRELLEEVGFEDVVFHGGVEGEALDLESRRCIAVARRPREGGGA